MIVSIPSLLGHSGYDVNVTFSNMDDYGNFMLAGWGSKEPYGWNSGVQQGYIALIDQKGVPYWVYSVKDVFNANGNNTCTFISH